MPAYGVVAKTATNEMPCIQPSVTVDGKAADYFYCSGIEESVGLTPSKALLRFGYNGLDIASPITLNKYARTWKAGARVNVSHGGRTFFNGMLMKRKDQGALDAVTWEAWGDLMLLNMIPVRGCLVWDETDQEVKYISGYVHRHNPKGQWNCMPATVGGALYPVFSATADLGQTYQSPDQTFDTKMEAGVLTAWTPRRALLYLQLLCNLGVGDVPGLRSPEWRSLKTSDRLAFRASSLNITAKDTDASSPLNPLDRKLPDVTLQSKTMLGALHEILRATGTHGIGTWYTGNSSYVYFYAKEIAQDGGNTLRTTIPLLRGGTMDDPNSAYDFEVDEDASEVMESVLVEGARRHIETELFYEDGNADSTIIPSWSALEQTAFLSVIKGRDDGGGQFAIYPSIQGGTDVSTFLIADGNGGRLKINAGGQTTEAVSLARACFPRVFRCFEVVSSALYDNSPFPLRGVSQGYITTDGYPFLNSPRPISQEQAQYFTYQLTRLVDKLPVRIQARDDGGIEWHEVTAHPGLRVTADGRIWFDGLIENISGGPYEIDQLFQPALSSIHASYDLSLIKVRDFKVNARMPLDHRVQGYASRDDGNKVLHPDIGNQLGGPPLLYIDSPDGYHNEQQINSSPSPAPEYFDQEQTLTMPLTRQLPPGSEEQHAEIAARRRLATCAETKRHSSWRMIGIRPEFRAGMWIDKVQTTGAEAPYEINAPCETILWDFLGQTTTIGGILAQLTRNKVKAVFRGVPAAVVGAATGGSGVTGLVESKGATHRAAGYVEDE